MRPRCAAAVHAGSWTWRAAVAVLVLMSLVTKARAQSGIDLMTYRPAVGGAVSHFSVETAHVAAAGGWSLSLSVDRATTPLRVLSDDGITLPPLRERMAAVLAASYSLFGWLELGASLPMFDQQGNPEAIGMELTTGRARGDVALSAKTSWFSVGWFSLATSIAATLPTASGAELSGTGVVTVYPRLIAGLDFGGTRISANIGVHLRPLTSYRDMEQGDELKAGLGAAHRLFSGLTVVAEVFGAARAGNANSDTITALEAYGGIRWCSQGGFCLAGGAGGGLLDAIGSPSRRVLVGLSYAPGRSAVAVGRGQVEPQSRADLSAAGRDAGGGAAAESFVAWIENRRDHRRRNDAAAGFGGGELVVANRDNNDCAATAEGAAAGACVVDTDGDGIADHLDQCPNRAEDRDGFEDEDGCDDPDNDGDGVVAALDQCDRRPETINGVADDAGCPDRAATAVPAPGSPIELVDGIEFHQGSAQLTAGGESVVRELGAALRANSAWRRIRVTVHYRRANRRKLARKRVDEIVQRLANEGIRSRWVEARTMGPGRRLVGQPAAAAGRGYWVEIRALR